MNCRAHGKDGYWRQLCRGLTGGYDQVDAAVDACIDPDAFACYPDKPPSPMLAVGQCVDLVSYISGTVKSTPGYDLIRSLESLVVLEVHIGQGSKIKPTIDLATDNGCCAMMNTDRAALDRDIAIIRELESTQTMFELYENEQQLLEDREWETKREQLLRKPCSLEFVAPPDMAQPNKVFVPPGVVPEGKEL